MFSFCFVSLTFVEWKIRQEECVRQHLFDMQISFVFKTFRAIRTLHGLLLKGDILNDFIHTMS